ncbi:hypothetical protein HZU83_10955 [Sphaerotilus montanus]|uniref:Uncharacterized protein n=1 Tax=Sphaerotilus montanus TaxID=522889 RepID=A0A7Y9U7S5_9BURK|nr:hypothetical protein [Sphaerotilus montanus]NYG35458.1 hypothetical protein [Sphaerotilus montanus]NZD57205.1 hypothetical protein [Sphaerotilus montanus]
MPLLYGFGSLFVALMGRNRKWGFWGYFWASLLMSPVLGLLFVLAGDKPERKPKAPKSALQPSPVAATPAVGVPAASVKPVATSAPAVKP